MKFAFGILVLVLVAAQARPQGCNGRGSVFGFQNVRERHVVRSFSTARGGCSGVAAYGTGCSGTVQMVPVTEYKPVTRWVVADLPPKAAPQPMPKGPPPIIAYAPIVQTAEPPLFGSRIRATVGVGIHGIAGLLCRAKHAMVAVVTAPLHLRSKEVHREFHLFKR